jgi:hypothetical protein
VSNSLPPIIRAADVLLAEVERAVTAMPRRQKYSYGQRLAQAAMGIAQQANRAWRDRAGRTELLRQLVLSVDDFKTLLRLGKAVQAYSSARFEHLARQAYELGKQVGGWLKGQQQYPMGQNAPAPRGNGQRAPILSSRAAQQPGAKR